MSMDTLTQQELSVHTKLILDIYSVMKRGLFKTRRDENYTERTIEVEEQDSVNSCERGLDGVRRNRGKLN